MWRQTKKAKVLMIQILEDFAGEDHARDLSTDTRHDQLTNDAAYHQAHDSHVIHIEETNLEHYGQPISTVKALSRKRKNEIRKKMYENRKQIEALRVHYKWMIESMRRLEQKMADLSTYHQEELEDSLPQLLGKLSRHHGSTRLLVQSRIYELSGAGRMVLEAPSPQEKLRLKTEASVPTKTDDLDQNASIAIASYSSKSSLSRIPVKQNEWQRPDEAHVEAWLGRIGDTLLSSSSDLLANGSRDVHIVRNKRIEDKAILDGDTLQLIWAKAMEDIPDLNAVSCSRGDEKFLRGEVSRTKSWLEECLLEAVNFEYKFKLICESQLHRFFLTKNTLEHTATHIFNHFEMNEGFGVGFIDNQTFLPDMTFICNHWYTEYLQEALAALGKNHQRRIVKTSLLLTINAFEKYGRHYQYTRSNMILEAFANENLHDALEKLQRGNVMSEATEDESHLLLKNTIGALISFYQSPNTLQQKLHRCEKIEYLLTHYILKYVRNYYEAVNMRDLLDGNDSIDYCLFEKQFLFLEAGLEFNQTFNLALDCSYFPVWCRRDQETVKRDLLKKKKKELMFELAAGAERFKKIKLEMDLLAAGDSQLSHWMKGTDSHDFEGGNVSSQIIGELIEASQNPGKPKDQACRNLWLSPRFTKPSFLDKLTVFSYKCLDCLGI